MWREEITDTRKTRACISRSHSQVSQIQPTNLSTLNPQTPELQEGDILYEGDGMAPLFTVSIFTFTMTEPSCSRPGSALSLGAAPRARLTRTIRTHSGWWLHSCHLQRTRHPDIQPHDKYPGHYLPSGHSRMLTGKMPVRCTGLMTRGWWLVTKIDGPATVGSRRQLAGARL